MLKKIDQDNLLKRFDSLVREIENLKRDLLRSLTVGVKHREMKPTLFGSIKGGDVTEEMIEESKQSVLRPLEDV
jgi:hypothetical protein